MDERDRRGGVSEDSKNTLTMTVVGILPGGTTPPGMTNLWKLESSQTGLQVAPLVSTFLEFAVGFFTFLGFSFKVYSFTLLPRLLSTRFNDSLHFNCQPVYRFRTMRFEDVKDPQQVLPHDEHVHLQRATAEGKVA